MAVVAVVAFHAAKGEAGGTFMGVDMFFVLSGYLITTILTREYDAHGRVDVGGFYWRRAFRLLPALAFMLAVYLAVAGHFWPRHTTMGHYRDAAISLAFLSDYVAAFSLEPKYLLHTWSLAVEEHFYLVFPVALLFLARRQPYHRIAAILFAGCVAVLAWRLAVFALLDNPGHYNYLATDARLDSLLYGCIMGMWLNPALDPAPKVIGPRGWLAICAAALGLIAASFLVRSEVFREAWRYSVQGIALFPLFYCAIRYSRSPAFAWLNARPVRALGIVSYTFYLSHFAAIQFAGKALGSEGLARGLLGFAFAAAFSAASYILIEKRFAALRHKLHR